VDPERAARLRAYATDSHQFQLSAEGLLRLDRYLSLLTTWNRTTRLTASTDEAQLVEHHVADCLATVPITPAGGCIVDIGSGAGFPGVVIQALRTDTTAVLIEPRRRRASFLSEVVRTLPLPGTTVVCARAEALESRTAVGDGADVAVSRALRVDVFLPLAVPLLRVGGLAVAMQTPTSALPDRTVCNGLDPMSPVDYRLPDGSPRRLLLYRRLC
jgi:16S rRNA (guanine527-N7)-methyltransferase